MVVGCHDEITRVTRGKPRRGQGGLGSRRNRLARAYLLDAPPPLFDVLDAKRNLGLPIAVDPALVHRDGLSSRGTGPIEVNTGSRR